jgi:hypothetical protein
MNAKRLTTILGLFISMIFLNACSKSVNKLTSNENSAERVHLNEQAENINSLYFSCKAHE